ncbi:MAG: DUF3604 domain-containing protein [bacterium]|nr:DUF3604 domain-containing protein [bacterium]
MDKRLDPYRFDVGSARVEPDTPIVAGSFFTRKLIFTAGKYGTDEGARILICKRLSSDMEIPQFTDPAASGYVTASCANPRVALALSYLEAGYLDDWRSGIAVRIAKGYLNPGDAVEVILGDTRGGGPGIRCQTFPETRHTFKIAVDTFNHNHFYEIEEDPEVRVMGGAPAELQLAPAQRPVLGQPFGALLRLVDSWGNPAEEFAGEVRIEGASDQDQVPERVVFSPADGGAKKLSGLVLHGEGPYRLRLAEGGGLAGDSPPIVPRKQGEEYALYWGDIHGQTRSTVGTGTVEEYFRFARDKGGVDFAAWQGNDFRVRKEDWQEVIEGCRAFNAPGGFVTILGYEWSGNRSGGGDYNVYFSGDAAQIHRSSHARIDDLSDAGTDRYPISALWETFRGRGDVLSVAHIGGRACNLDYFDPEFVRLVEVHSHHGTFEWFVEEALERGFKVGITGGSDDHTGRQGLVYPNRRTNSVVTFDVKGGLMGLYAKALTREAVWEAMKARRTYGTNGERILLKSACAGHWMGEEFDTKAPPVIEVEVHGTAPLLDVEIRRGSETIYRHAVNAPEGGGGVRRIRVQWSGVVNKSGRDKKVDWKGGISLDRGRIVSFTPYALDQYDDVVQGVSNKVLRFDTKTSGDPDGVFLDIEAPAGAKLRFFSHVVSFEAVLAEVGYEPLIFPGGGVNIRAQISEVARELKERDAVFRFTDEEIPRGCNPYWVRVLQADGGQAWSSPLYINYA